MRVCVFNAAYLDATAFYACKWTRAESGRKNKLHRNWFGCAFALFSKRFKVSHIKQSFSRKAHRSSNQTGKIVRNRLLSVKGAKASRKSDAEAGVLNQVCPPRKRGSPALQRGTITINTYYNVIPCVAGKKSSVSQVDSSPTSKLTLKHSLLDFWKKERWEISAKLDYYITSYNRLRNQLHNIAKSVT